VPEIESTLAAIDAATGCQQCEGPLGDSPSDSFCSAECQDAWFAARSEPLVDYREPAESAAHYSHELACGCWNEDVATRYRELLEATMAIYIRQPSSPEAPQRIDSRGTR